MISRTGTGSLPKSGPIPGAGPRARWKRCSATHARMASPKPWRRLLSRARERAEADERAAVAAEITEAVKRAGLSRAEFASRIGTSASPAVHLYLWQGNPVRHALAPDPPRSRPGIALRTVITRAGSRKRRAGNGMHAPVRRTAPIPVPRTQRQLRIVAINGSVELYTSIGVPKGALLRCTWRKPVVPCLLGVCSAAVPVPFDGVDIRRQRKGESRTERHGPAFSVPGERRAADS